MHAPPEQRPGFWGLVILGSPHPGLGTVALAVSSPWRFYPHRQWARHPQDSDRCPCGLEFLALLPPSAGFRHVYLCRLPCAAFPSQRLSAFVHSTLRSCCLFLLPGRTARRMPPLMHDLCLSAAMQYRGPPVLSQGHHLTCSTALVCLYNSPAACSSAAQVEPYMNSTHPKHNMDAAGVLFEL